MNPGGIELLQRGTFSDSARVPRRNEPFKPRASDDEQEDPIQRKGALGTFDVFSLIVNKMIGTGIYTAPATVFFLTGNKSLTLGLFGVGFLYSLMSMVIYLDFATALPFNGGELVYLDEITSHTIRPDVLGADHRSRAEPRPQAPLPSPTQDMNGDDIAPNETGFVPSTIPRKPTGQSNGYARPSGHNNSASGSNPNPTAPTTPVALDSGRRLGWKKRILGDGLLAFIIYSLIFIAFFNSGSNSMQFGRMVLVCISADKIGNDDAAPDINRDVMRYIGVTVLSVICLLQYFAPNFGRSLNRFIAVVKIIFLLALIFVGAAARNRNLRDPDGGTINRADDWHEWYPVKSRLSFAKALLAVLFSFEGWENATFVAGEIPSHKHYVLRRGFIAAVFTVGILYLIVVGVVLHSITWFDLTARSENVNYAPMLTGNGRDARRAWAIISAISSFGSLNAIIYTFSRVKQAIGQANVLPWSRYLKLDDNLQRPTVYAEPSSSDFINKAPQGGLIVHWLMSVVVISGSASINSTLESAGLPGYMQTYIHCFVLMIISLSYFNLKAREDALRGANPRRQEYSARAYFRPSRAEVGVARVSLAVCIALYALLNLAILVINSIPPYTGSDGSDVAFKGFGFPIMIGALLLFGTTYYILFFGAARRVYPPLPAPADGTEVDEPAQAATLPIVEKGILSANSKLNLMRWADVRCEVRKDHYYNMKLERVYRFGRRWRMVYFLPGDESSAATPSNAVDGMRQGAGQQTAPDIPDGVTWSRFLYWFFGGSRLKVSPREAFKIWRQDKMEMMEDIVVRRPANVEE